MSNFVNRKNSIVGREYILDTPQQQKDFIQFIPATVKHVVNNRDAAASTDNDNESNCIAIEKNIYLNEATLGGMQVNLFRPLMRGFIDSIKKGDAVLVIKIGGTGYYLGPINISNFPSQTDS